MFRAQQVHQFIVNDFDDLLAGLDALDHFLAERLGLHPVDEIPGNLEIHVRFQQRHPHLAQRVADVLFRNLAETAKILESVLELAAQRIEHELKVEVVTRRSKWKKVLFVCFVFLVGTPLPRTVPLPESSQVLRQNRRHFVLGSLTTAWPFSIFSPPRFEGLVGYPSGQRGQTVNLLAYAFTGSNPVPTTNL